MPTKASKSKSFKLYADAQKMNINLFIRIIYALWRDDDNDDDYGDDTKFLTMTNQISFVLSNENVSPAFRAPVKNELFNHRQNIWPQIAFNKKWMNWIYLLALFSYLFFDSPKFFFFLPIAAQYHGNKGFYRAKNFIRGIGKINSIQSFPEQTMEISLFAVWLDVCLVGFHFEKNNLSQQYFHEMKTDH